MTIEPSASSWNVVDTTQNQNNGIQSQLLDSIRTDKNIKNIIKNLFESHTFRTNYQELLEKHKLKSFTVKQLNELEKAYLNIPRAATSYYSMEGRILGVSIILNKGLDDKDLMTSLCVEFCNAFFINDHDFLNNQASKGKIDKKSYVFSREYLEWLALGVVMKIFHELGMDLEMYSDTLLNDFDTYFEVQKSDHHTKFLENRWEQLNLKVQQGLS